MGQSSPFSRYNLRRNPFGELTRDERAELAVVDVSSWRERLSDPRAAIQFVAPCGHGKTTHLLALQRCLSDAAYVYLPEDRPFPPIPDRRPLLLDEAQRLGWRLRRRVFRAGGPLVLGTHVNLETRLRRAGFHVTTVELADSLTVERLGEMLNRRIEASRAGSGETPRVHPQFALTLLRSFGTDIRRIEHHLYAQFQDAVQRGAPWPPVS